jgi:hypothetical protein
MPTTEFQAQRSLYDVSTDLFFTRNLSSHEFVFRPAVVHPLSPLARLYQPVHPIHDVVLSRCRPTIVVCVTHLTLVVRFPIFCADVGRCYQTQDGCQRLDQAATTARPLGQSGRLRPTSHEARPLRRRICSLRYQAFVVVSLLKPHVPLLSVPAKTRLTTAPPSVESVPFLLFFLFVWGSQSV